MAKPQSNETPRINNRRAFHDYFIEAKIECGMVLVGSEVKSLRQGKAQLHESFARVERDGLILYGCHIDPYEKAASVNNHEPNRDRKLLVLAAAGPTLPAGSPGEHAPTALVLVLDDSPSSGAVVGGRQTLARFQEMADFPEHPRPALCCPSDHDGIRARGIRRRRQDALRPADARQCTVCI